MTAQNGVNTALTRPGRVFLGRLHMGDLSPPHMGGQDKSRDKTLMGGTKH